MNAMLPEAKEYTKVKGKTKEFSRIEIEVKNEVLGSKEIIKLLEMKCWKESKKRLLQIPN